MTSEDKKKLDFILNPDKRKHKHIRLAIALTVLFLFLALLTSVVGAYLSATFGLFIFLVWFFQLAMGKWPAADGDVYEVVTKKNPDGTIKEEEKVQIDFSTYLSPSSNHHKANTSCLITGTAGMGKTELACYLMTVVKDPKIVFSFKGERFFGCGIPILDVSKAIPSDLFASPGDFIGAYKVAFPVAEKMTGITAVAAEGVLKEALRGCRSWDQLFKNLSKPSGSNIQREAKIHVVTQLKNLSFDVSPSKFEDMNPGGGMLFDFSRLEDENAKSFYAEILLRMLWRKIRREEMSRVVLVIDEVHHILKGARAEATIFAEILREIREYGTAWAITQNYSDIEDEVRNQFDTQLCFRTTSENDLKALGQISAALTLKVKAMARYRFVDAKFPLQWYYPAWEADISKLAHTNPVFVQVEGNAIDFEKEILERLPDYQSSVARRISTERKVELDFVRKKVAKIVDSLRNEGIIEYRDYKNSRGEVVKIYWKKDGSETALKRYMLLDAKRLLAGAGFIVLQKTSDVGEFGPLDLGFCEIRVKYEPTDPEATGERLIRKPVLMLLPNDREKEKYKSSFPHSQIVLMPDLVEAVRKLKTQNQDG